MNILSIQSHVSYGHVGNASAVFPMQRLGVEVWPIHTVQFSNHTGYGAWKGRVFDGPAIEELLEGIAERGVLSRCDGVLSGYMGSADIGTAILGAVARVRGASWPRNGKSTTMRRRRWSAISSRASRRRSVLTIPSTTLAIFATPNARRARVPSGRTRSTGLRSSSLAPVDRWHPACTYDLDEAHGGRSWNNSH